MMRLWCYCAKRRAAISNLKSKNLLQLQGHTPHSMALGESGDISNLCQFRWYEWYYFKKCKASFPEPAEELGCCLVPSKNEGNEIFQSVIHMNGRVVPRRSLHRLIPGAGPVLARTLVDIRHSFIGARLKN